MVVPTPGGVIDKIVSYIICKHEHYTVMACGWDPLACATPVCNRLNLLVIAQQPYTKYPGATLALPTAPQINGQPNVAVTSGLPWAPVLLGRPGATFATGAHADAVRAPFYAEFGPAVRNAIILTYSMTAYDNVPGTTYKEAKGTLTAYPRVANGSGGTTAQAAAAQASAAQAGALAFVYRWCGPPFYSACTGLPLVAQPVAFEVTALTAVSVRFTVLSQPIVVNMGDPAVQPADARCAETCVLVLVEQACPPVPACLQSCAIAPPPYLGTSVYDITDTIDADGVIVLTLLYRAYAGVTNLRVNCIAPGPDVASVVVQPMEGPAEPQDPTLPQSQNETLFQSGAVRITFMFTPEAGAGRVEFSISGDILSPACVHAAGATSATSGSIVVFVNCTPPELTLGPQNTLGPTCATVDWVAPYDGTYRCTVQANPPEGQVVVSEDVPSTETPLTFTGLQPLTQYEVSISGGPCGARGPAGTVLFTTLAPVALGAYVIQESVVPSVDTPLETCDMTLRYDDYPADCVTLTPLTNASYFNPPEGWTGQVTMLDDPVPFRWLVTRVPFSSVATFEVFGACGDGSGDCACPGCTTLRRSLNVNVPAPPPDDCGEEPTPEPVLLGPVGAFCLTFVWVSNPVFAGGYDWTLEPGSFSGNVPNNDADEVSVSGLDPDTDYTFTLVGVCYDGSISAPASISATTGSVCTPNLSPIMPTATNKTWVPSSRTYTVTVSTRAVTNAVCATGPLVLSLQPTQPIRPLPVITQPTPTANRWTVTGVPGGATLLLQFTAQPVGATPLALCTGCCVIGAAVPPLPFSTTVPPAPSNPCALQTVTPSLVAGSLSPTCANFALSYSSSAGFVSFDWTLEPGFTGSSPAGTTVVPFTGLTYDTEYTFSVTGVCTGGATTQTFSAPSVTTPAETEPAMAPWGPQTSVNPLFRVQPDGSWTAQVQYPAANAVCVAGNPALVWDGPAPTGAAITPLTSASGNLLWFVTGLVANTAYTLQLTAFGAGNDGETCPTCTSSTAAVTPVPVDFTTPTDPPPPLADPPFLLAITNYQGPPARIIQAGNNLVCNGAGCENDYNGAGVDSEGNPAPGSYAAQLSMCQTYATKVIDGFISYHLNTPIVIGTDPPTPPFYLPISTLYIGHSGDPAAQGLINHNSAGKFSLPYNAAIPAPSLFVNPPYFVMYLALAVYNWEAANGVHVNPRQVSMANNHYGSSRGGEEWWFRLSVNADTGLLTPTTPLDPKKLPSLVDGILNDGNGPNQDITLAGWNCLEAWFAYVAFLNQQLRLAIAAGDIRGAASIPMTLADLTQENAKYFQISAITADQEGGGFANTLYPTNNPGPGQYWQPWFAGVTSADCNYIMTSLWNKWVNQATVLDPSPPIGLPSQFVANLGNLVVAAGRPASTMPPVAFTLPCAVSLTTPGLIKDMTVADLGSPDFSAVSNIMFEVYDTSDASPFRCLGASTTPAACDGSVPQSGVTGAPFTPDVYTDSHPTSNTDTYAQFPQHFAGVWDNLKPAPVGCNNAIQLNAAGTALIGGGGQGSFTVFNNKNLPIAPRIALADATTGFDPWTYDGSPWITRYVVGGPVSSLGWALEGSRYDLFNGKWAAKAHTVTGKPLTYDAVAQGSNTADGAELIEDLTTGLKGRAARGVLSVGTGAGPGVIAAASRCVWMLSNEAGPFVDTENNAFAYNPPAGDDLSIWPAWSGMRGQPYGPGSGTASAPVRWNLNQMYLGQYDPSPSTVVGSNCTENNFGVFADFHIQVAAWLALARDMRGEGVNTSAICQGAIQYTDTTTGPPLLGCYELAFMPLSWFGPE